MSTSWPRFNFVSPLTTSKRLIKVSCGQASAAALPLRGRGGQGGVRSAVRGRRGRAGELWLAESGHVTGSAHLWLVRSTATPARASWPRQSPPPPPCPASPPAPCPPSPRPSPTRCGVWLHSVSTYLPCIYLEYLIIYPTRSRLPAPTPASPVARGQPGTPAWTQVTWRPAHWYLQRTGAALVPAPAHPIRLCCLPSGRGSAACVPAWRIAEILHSPGLIVHVAIVHSCYTWI